MIAIQNARLFNDTQEALAHQTATADILAVISESPTDVGPVFQAIAERARALCKANVGATTRLEGATVHLAGVCGATPQAEEAMRRVFPMPLDETPPNIRRAVTEAAPIQIADVRLEPGYPIAADAKDMGFLSIMSVPLLHEGRAIGTIGVARREPGLFPDSAVALLQTFARQAVIAIQNVRLFNETQEALAQQKASAEVLTVISHSVSDTQPVFDKILDSCKHLFGGDELDVLLVDEQGQLQIAAYVGKAFDVVSKTFPAPVDITPAGRAIRERRVVHYPDVLHGADVPNVMRRMGQLVGYQSLAFAPMLWNDEGIGAIGVARSRGAFSDKELAQLQTFADQAVIAIQNSRLFNETNSALQKLEQRTSELGESLETQTAISQVLRVISESPTDVAPVFEAIMDSGMRLFQSQLMAVFRYDGRLIHIAAHRNWSAEALAQAQTLYPMPVDENTLAGQVILSGKAIAVDDTQSELHYSSLLASLAKTGGWRRMIIAPMLKDGQPVGTVHVAWRDPGVTPQRQIELLQTFADQAVIAIENVRLLKETKEALEQQTASAEVLQVISSSVSDTAPVFDKILDSCKRLFGVDQNGISLVREDGQVYYAALRVDDDETLARLNEGFPRPLKDSYQGYVIRKGRVVHYPDIVNGPNVPEAMREHGRRTGNYSLLVAPMLWEGRGIGTIHVVRMPPRPYTEKDANLLKTFADQAVIAIQNARLFNETQEALEQQTASAEILQVIAGSPDDVQPVLDAIVHSARKLVGGFSATAWRVMGEHAHLAAFTTTSDTGAQALRDIGALPIATSHLLLPLRTREPQIVVDVETEAGLGDVWRDLARKRGYRSMLGVPLLHQGMAIGVISVTRKEPGDFPPRLVELLKTFARQAVIAIENVRLFNETQEALERQTATANVLKAISRTTFDLAAVLEVLIGTAARLCGASLGVIFRVDGDLCLASGLFGATPALIQHLAAHPPRLSIRDGITSEAAASRHPVQVEDAATDARYGRPDVQRVGGYRTLLAVPILREAEAIGVLTLGRAEARAFGAKEIDLVTSFADQAAIAMENVRLFNETQQALERQTATAEVLQVISRSVSETAPVFEKIIQSCQKLLNANYANAALIGEDGLMHLIQDHAHAVDEAQRDAMAASQAYFPRPVRDSIQGYAIHKRTVLHYPDVHNGPGVPDGVRSVWTADNFSMLVAPMFWEGKGIGAITVTRYPPSPFLDDEIELLKTFANQAVIAIQNARLFNDTQRSLERQTATAEILKVIASSPDNVQPVFDAIARSSNRLLGGYSTMVARIHDDALHMVAFTSTTPDGDAALKRSFPIALSNFPVGEAIRRGEQVPIVDTEAVEEGLYQIRDLARARGYRSMLFCPLVQGGQSIGMISVTRREPGPFAPHQVELLQTFADQAVIAIENVRLFNETKEALEQQTATSDVLQVIAGSMSDAQPVFDKILESCGRLFRSVRERTEPAG